MKPTIGLCMALVIATLSCGIAFGAPAKPAHDLWIEGETCVDHDFTVIGRDKAFAPCYGSAILQLQTHNEAPTDGYHATFSVEIPEEGYWELLIAATRTDGGGRNLSPYLLQVQGYRDRRIEGFAVRDGYGPGDIFGWLAAGKYKLPEGPAKVTLRCRDRRASDNAYLLYVDALALRRAAAPAAKAQWIADPGDEKAWRLTGRFSLEAIPSLPVLHLVSEGSCRATLNGHVLGTSEGWAAPGGWYVGQYLRRGDNELRLDGRPSEGRGVLARLLAGPPGHQALIAATDGAWRAQTPDGDEAVRVLGSCFDAPWGDMTVQPSVKIPVGATNIPIKTGNLSVDLIQAAARGQEPPAPRPRPEFDDYRDIGSIRTVEDYICWLALEPERGRLQWEFYERNCRELEARGIKYAVYPWLHFPPGWAAESELWEPLVSLKTGKTTWAPSIWSPRTLEIFDRFYSALREHFGDRVREVFVSMVCDYGEVGYPVGMADWVVPAEYKGADFWCGDKLARADFRLKMLDKYQGLEQLNAAWGTDFARAEDITYPEWTATEGPDYEQIQRLAPPERAQARRRWLDFIQWYLDAMVEFAAKAVGVSRRYFADAPHEIKIGFGSERVMFGADYTAYVAHSRQDGYTVRSTHGKLPPYFYRRFSTAAKHYGVGLVTEPPSNVSREEEIERIFKDATSGTTEYFDYPGNILGASDIFARYANYMQGEHSLTDIAFLFPTTDHRLRPGQNLPLALLAACNESRDLLDWDILDERLIRDGALDGYRVLLAPEGNVIERDVLDRIEKWVHAGGLLIRSATGSLETVQGDPGCGSRLFVPVASLPTRDELSPPDVSPSDAWMLDVGSAQDEAALTGDWNNRESGHFEWGGRPGEVTKRWTGAAGGVLLPVDPAQSYELAIAVALHPKRLKESYSILVNGKPIGEVAPQRTSVFRARIGPEVWGREALATLLFDVEGWRPSQVDGSGDNRTLGLAVNWVKLWRADLSEPDTANPPMIRRALDMGALARQCARSLGAGATVLLPAADGRTFADAVVAIIADGASLPGAQSIGAPLDGKRDGVWTALMPTRLLLYNSTDEPRQVAVSLDATALTRLGAVEPQTERVTVDMLPRSIASIELPGGEVVTR